MAGSTHDAILSLTSVRVGMSPGAAAACALPPKLSVRRCRSRSYIVPVVPDLISLLQFSQCVSGDEGEGFLRFEISDSGLSLFLFHQFNRRFHNKNTTITYLRPGFIFKELLYFQGQYFLVQQRYGAVAYC